MTIYANANAKANEARAVPTPRHRADLPLHAELYLLAHNDDTGERHINDQTLAIGLAGALLVELVLSKNVVVGWVFDDFDYQWHERPGQLFVARHGPAGSPLLDAALAAINRIVYAQPRGEHLRIWMQSFAANDLYDRVHAAMVTAGVIRRTTRSRFAGLVKTQTYLPVEVGYTTRVRTRVRDAIAFHEPSKYRPPAAPDDDGVALCGLTKALELTEFLYRNQPNREINDWLQLVVDRHGNEAIAAIIRAVDAGRGDVAVAAMG